MTITTLRRKQPTSLADAALAAIMRTFARAAILVVAWMVLGSPFHVDQPVHTFKTEVVETCPCPTPPLEETR